MDEADRCDRVALVQRGRVLAIDTPEAIKRSFDRPLLAVRARDPYRALLALRAYPHTHTVYPFGASLHYTDARRDRPAAELAHELQAFLKGRGLDSIEATPTAATIEDSFMARMGANEGTDAG
jgi:ABC-type multidrug transport system ATPase subunit